MMTLIPALFVSILLPLLWFAARNKYRAEAPPRLGTAWKKLRARLHRSRRDTHRLYSLLL